MDKQTKDGELVSVVVPTYARSEMLLRALDSLNRQTYSPLEIIVVDDNGAGCEQQLETQARVSSFSPRAGISLKYVARAKNGGGAMARNTGIEAAVGDYIAFLDDDDEYLPSKVELQMQALRDSGAAFCYAHCKTVVDGTGKEIYYRRACEGVPLFEQAYCGCIAATSQWLVRKDALFAVGCFTDTPSKQDSILLYKLLLAGYTVCCVSEILSLYHEDEGVARISTRGKTLVGERKYAKMIRDSFDRFTPSQRRKLDHAMKWREATLLWAQHARSEAFPLYASAFVDEPVSACKKLAWSACHVAKQAMKAVLRGPNAR